MFKLPMYVIFLILNLVVPVLVKIVTELKAKAAATPETWDDTVVAAFETVLEFLKTPEIFIPKTK
jgi:hypothetical protein